LANRKTPLLLDEGHIKKNAEEEKKSLFSLSFSVKINNDIASTFFSSSLSLSFSLPPERCKIYIGTNIILASSQQQTTTHEANIVSIYL